MKILKGLILVLLSIGFISGCSTDFRIHADYKEIMVVYGLLEANKTEHVLKITKAFLDPDRGAYEVAKIEDSLYFKSLTVELEEILNGSINRTITFQEFEDNNKPSGDFAYPNQKLYKATATLDETALFRLKITNNETGNIVTSETELVTAKKMWLLAPNPAAKIAIPPDSIKNFEVKWSATKGGKVYQSVMRMRYAELNNNGDTNYVDTLDLTLVRRVKTKSTSGLDADMSAEISRTELYSYMGRNIPEPTAQDARRVWLGVDILITVGAEELSNYIDVSNSQVGLVETQSKKEYTNIDNGLGIFSSRLTRSWTSIPFTDPVINEIACDPLTRHLKFTKTDGTTVCL